MDSKQWQGEDAHDAVGVFDITNQMLEILEKYTKMADLTKKGMILFFNLCFNLEETEKVKGVLKKKGEMSSK